MALILLVPALLQILALLVDELWFHRRRGLPRQERASLPLNALTAAACYAWLSLRAPNEQTLVVYAGLAIFSCVFITRDELVHAQRCGAAELRLHAILFMLHPSVFAALGVVWWLGLARGFVRVELAAMLALAAYQFAYWRWRVPRRYWA